MSDTSYEVLHDVAETKNVKWLNLLLYFRDIRCTIILMLTLVASLATYTVGSY